MSRKNAIDAGVADRATFVEGDIFESDFSDATVVMLYLYPKVNRRLQPVLIDQLPTGTRIVSHRFKVGDWKPIKRIKVEGRFVYLYHVP